LMILGVFGHEKTKPILRHCSGQVYYRSACCEI
jgi:hypothetical protein